MPASLFQATSNQNVKLAAFAQFAFHLGPPKACAAVYFSETSKPSISRMTFTLARQLAWSRTKVR